MNQKGNYGKWVAEVTQLRLRKTDSYGSPYTGVATLTVVDGSLHLEGLMCDNFTREDYRTIREIVKDLGFPGLHCKRNDMDIIKDIKEDKCNT